MYSIGQLSQQTGVSAETIRYYERIALLSPPQRAENGYRQYNDTDVERLRFIRRSRSLDFTLDDIREILAFRERCESPCAYVTNVIEERIGDIEQRIHELEKLRDELNDVYEKGKQFRTYAVEVIFPRRGVARYALMLGQVRKSYNYLKMRR